LHHRDYETILADIRILPTSKRGLVELARFDLTYSDLSGAKHAAGPYSVMVEYVDAQAPVTGFSDGMVMKSGTMLSFARTLKRIGEVYYAGAKDLDQTNVLRNSLWQEKGDSKPTQSEYLALTSPQIAELESTYKGRIRIALDLTVAMRKDLENVRLRLDNEGFDNEIRMMEQYVAILGKELELSAGEADRIRADNEPIPTQPEQRPLADELHGLFREIALDIGTRKGVIAVSGFATAREKQPRLVAILNEMSVVELARVERLTVVERSRLEDVLAEQELALSDLMDTEKAISVGKLTAAQFILTGSVIEMQSSVVIFGRVINVQTAEVESAAQVILSKAGELATLL
jgi:TolB-like protein